MSETHTETQGLFLPKAMVHFCVVSFCFVNSLKLDVYLNDPRLFPVCLFWWKTD